MSVAVKVTASAVLSVTVKVTTPKALVVAGEVVMTEWPLPWFRDTDLPPSATSLSSFKVTVTVEDAIPSASTDDGEAVTVELATVAFGVVKVTVGVWDPPFSVTESEVSVAV